MLSDIHVRCENGPTYTMRTSGCIRIPDENVRISDLAQFFDIPSLDNSVKGHKGCCQSVYVRLYNALVLPVMDFGVPVTVTAASECITEMGKVQRAAMLKASGCLNSTSTDALEVLTNTVPIALHLKMRQAQEVVRITAKHDEDPLKK